VKALERQIEQLKGRLSAVAVADAGTDVLNLDGVSVLGQKVEANSPAALRDLMDRFKDKLRSGVVVLGVPATPGHVDRRVTQTSPRAFMPATS